ncbi:MAG: type II secretion system protein [Candidatus Omnitrophota bacterium]
MEKRGRFYFSNSKKGFTLIELLVSIAITVIITAAIYFSLNSALDSWGYLQNQLALQKVLSEAIEEVIAGTEAVHGLRDSLEITSAGAGRVEFIPPWSDDTHMAVKNFAYTLNRRIKPGTAVPIGEAKYPESNKYRIVPIKIMKSEDLKISQVKLGYDVPAASQLRFTYHPDPKANLDVFKTIWWDSETYQIYSEDLNGLENISRNPFGIQITNMKLSYYDNANNLITDFEWVDNKDLNMITGIEVSMEAKLGQHTQNLISFINLRNAPMRSGYLALKQDMRLPIPDSHNVRIFSITNISGVANGDELQIEAVPEFGETWRAKIKFSRAGLAEPKIESCTIEYPPQNIVYTEYPRMSIDVGLDLLTIGASGLYDYDDDNETDDIVMLEGEVMLKVIKMDIEGVGLFIRP